MSGPTPNIANAAESPLAILKDVLLGSVTLYEDLEYRFKVRPVIEGLPSAGNAISKCSSFANRLADNPKDSDASLEFVNCVTKNIENKEQFKTELSALKKSEEYEVAVQERNRIIAATNACSNQIKKARQVETEYGPNSMEHIYAAKKMYDCTTTSANIESLSESWNAFKECYKPEGEFFNGLEHRYVANQCRPAFLKFQRDWVAASSLGGLLSNKDELRVREIRNVDVALQYFLNTKY